MQAREGLSLSRQVAAVGKLMSALQAPPVIHTPHALPMFKEAKQIRKRKSEKDRDDAIKYHKPEAGSSAATLGRGAAGLIGKTGGTLLTQYILKNHVSSLNSSLWVLVILDPHPPSM